MRKVFDLLPVLSLIIVFGSCEKDSIIRAGGDACEDFSTSNSLGTNTFIEADIQHQHPCFNPLNSDEFVYVYSNQTEGRCELRKRNLVSGTEVILVETSLGTADCILGSPSWGVNGYILYHSFDLNTWIVGDNGSELTQLTFSGKSQWPVWNSSATLFHSSSFSGINNSVLRDDSGIIQDTLTVIHNGLPSGIRNPCWANDSLMYIGYGRFSTNDFGVASFSLTNQQVNVLYSGIQEPYDIIKMDFSSGLNRVYFTTYEGLYQIDLMNSNTCKVLDFCTSIAYETFTISPSGNYLLGTRVTTRVIDEESWTIESDRDIYKIDLDNLSETKIELP